MSETTETTNTETEAPATEAKKPRKRAANPLSRDSVLSAITEAGLTLNDERAAFVSAGSKKGARLTFPKTGEKISRLFVYGVGVEAEGVVNLSEQERKDQRLGNVRAYIDFNSPSALEAVKAAAKAVAAAQPAETPAS